MKPAAFSKRFVGAGHSEEGRGQGGEGTLPSAHRARPFRRSGGIPAQNFFEIWIPRGAIWDSLGGSEASKLNISFAQLYLPSFSIKRPSLRLY